MADLDLQENEEKELLTIEELSQRLEGLYKDMEHIKRENLLFESYIIRNAKDIPKNDEMEERREKKKREKNMEKKPVLTNEEKYQIANFECDALKKNIDEGRIKSDSILETLRAILEETDMAITEIRKDAFDFQREILIGGENSRTGKIDAEKIIKYREEKLRQKDGLILKYESKKKQLETQIFKTDSQIRKKDEMGDDLKFIDFHQLQIENKKYVKEITEKNKKLVDIKIATGKIVTNLTKERKKLQEEIDKGLKMQAEIEEKINTIARTGIEKGDVKSAKNKETRKYKKLLIQKDQIQNIENPPEVMGYVKKKKEELELEKEIKDLKRKIEINSSLFEKAKKELFKLGLLK